jgi:hypothetical protein
MSEIRQYFEMLASVFGSEPEKEEEPSADELDAMRNLVLKHRGADPQSSEAPQSIQRLVEHLQYRDDRVFASGELSSAKTLRDAAQEIEEAIARRNIPLPEKPFFGFFHTELVNALAVRMRDQPVYLIAVNNGTFKFFTQIASLTSLLLPQEGNGQWLVLNDSDSDLRKFWAEEVQQRPALIESFVSRVQAYAESRPWLQMPPDLDGQERFKVQCALSAGARLFLVGHEYGHVVAGHLSKSPEVQFRAMNGADVVVSQPRWDEEFEADARGGDFAMGAMLAGTKSLEWSAVGIDTFFTTLHIFEMFKDFVQGRVLATSYRLPGCTDSHPPVLQRRDRLFNIMKGNFGSDFEFPEVMCRFIRIGMEALTEAALPHFASSLERAIKEHRDPRL